MQNKHEACVKALMELYPESSQMNVLDRNGFGKSALTDVRMQTDCNDSHGVCPLFALGQSLSLLGFRLQGAPASSRRKMWLEAQLLISSPLSSVGLCIGFSS